jgi:hypothetical protein
MAAGSGSGSDIEDDHGQTGGQVVHAAIRAPPNSTGIQIVSTMAELKTTRRAWQR